MRTLVDQIERSLDQPFYFLSLFGALAVPDIAGALGSEDGLASGKKYAAWYDQWVRPQFAKTLRASLPPEMADRLTSVESPLTGEACYRFRCSLLHQGTTQHPKAPYSRLIFVEPGATGNVFHYNILNDALNIDLRLFCQEVIVGARDWLSTVEDSAAFQQNYDRFARRYPTGLAPYIAGFPIIG